MSCNLVFQSFSAFSSGIIYGLLIKSYSDNPSLAIAEKDNWKKYDEEVFAHPDSVGKCGFISVVNNEPVGFASWDPRNRPEFAIIGHNCVLPVHRGKGYGKAQVKEILKRLKAEGFVKVKVSTGADEFFLPARKMYESCGFKETSRSKHPTLSGFEIVCFEATL